MTARTLIGLWMLVGLWMLIGSTAEVHAAQIYGTLTESSRPVTNASIRIVCGQQALEAKTNAQGSYSVRASVTGPCTLTIDGHPGASLTVYSYDDPVKYDLELAASGGSYKLRRR